MDERLRWAEDWELALRMADAGLAFQHIPEPLYCVREYAGSRLTNDTSEAEKARIEAELRAPYCASA